MRNSDVDVMYWKKSEGSAVPPFRRTQGDNHCVQCAIWPLHIEAEEVFQDYAGVVAGNVLDWVTGKLPLEPGMQTVLDIMDLLQGFDVSSNGDKHLAITQIIICADGKSSVFSGGFQPIRTTNVYGGRNGNIVLYRSTESGVYAKSSLDGGWSVAQNYFRKN